MFRRYRISIVDRNEIAREGLRRIFAERGVGAVDTRPDVSDLGSGMDHLIVITCADRDESLDCCRMARARYAGARIVIVVDDCCADIVMDALAAGADGVLSRFITVEPLIASLHLIALGEKVIPTCVVEEMPVRPRSPRLTSSDESDLSTRELAVLDRMAAGRPNKLISRDLGIAEGTVKVHVKSILRKLGVANRTQAALWAVDRGNVAPIMIQRTAHA